MRTGACLIALVAVAVASPALAGEPLCDALQQVVAAVPSGFTPLRGDAAGDGTWKASIALPGATDCSVTADSYACQVPVPAGDMMVMMDMRLVGVVGACFPEASHRMEIFDGGKVDHYAVPGADLGMGDISPDHTVMTFRVKKSP